VHSQALSLFVLLAFTLVLAPGIQAQTCTIDFDTTCPTTVAECGATFSGGQGCVVAGLANCYDTGTRAYRLNSPGTLTIALDPPIAAINVFFAYSGGAMGTMTFFDAALGGNQVGTPIITNGDCATFMPARQAQAFSTPVRRIEVTTGATAWIDTMELTPDTTPVLPASWGMIKTLYE
jgi:hypothetical protein